MPARTLAPAAHAAGLGLREPVRQFGRLPGILSGPIFPFDEALRRLRPQLVSKRRDLEEQPMEPDFARLLENAIDSLPSNYRTVFVLRDIESLSADETAACLMLSREIVETRLMHSRRMLHERLRPGLLDQPAEHVFPFRGARCAGLIERVAAGVALRADPKVAAPAP